MINKFFIFLVSFFIVGNAFALDEFMTPERMAMYQQDVLRMQALSMKQGPVATVKNTVLKNATAQSFLDRVTAAGIKLAPDCCDASLVNYVDIVGIDSCDEVKKYTEAQAVSVDGLLLTANGVMHETISPFANNLIADYCKARLFSHPQYVSDARIPQAVALSHVIFKQDEYRNSFLDILKRFWPLVVSLYQKTESYKHCVLSDADKALLPDQLKSENIQQFSLFAGLYPESAKVYSSYAHMYVHAQPSEKLLCFTMLWHLPYFLHTMQQAPDVFDTNKKYNLCMYLMWAVINKLPISSIVGYIDQVNKMQTFMSCDFSWMIDVLNTFPQGDAILV